jgi:hypothetical protein
VERRFQGQGIGGQLLLAAGRRCLLAAAEVGGVVLVVDARNHRAAAWYASYGAVPLDAPLSLLQPLATIEPALKKSWEILRAAASNPGLRVLSQNCSSALPRECRRPGWGRHGVEKSRCIPGHGFCTN